MMDQMKRKKQSLILFAGYFISLLGRSYGAGQAEIFGPANEFHVGVIVDMGSREGKIIQSCVSMAISDFYGLKREQQLRIVLHTRDSKGDPLHALSTALNLLENDKVGVILSAQTTILEAKFMAEFGDKTKIPIISFSDFGSSPPLKNNPFFIQIAQDETTEVEGIVATIELHNWQNVILIYEHDDNYWSDFFEDKKFQIAYRSALSTSSIDDRIIEELHKLKAMETKTFVVHVSHLLASRIFLKAKRLGMMSEGYAWIVTSKSMNQLDLTDSSITESMQGVLGFRSYIKESKELHNFTSRLRNELYDKEPRMPESIHLSLYGVCAYDVVWSLAKATNRMVLGVPEISEPNGRLNSIDFNNLRTYIHSSILMQELFQNKFEGLGGEFQFIDGKLISSTFEIVNVVGDRQTRVGFWTQTAKITKSLHKFNNGRHLSSTNDLERVTWPGGTSSKPKGRMILQMSGEKVLRIGVPEIGFTDLVKVLDIKDDETKVVDATGFCIEVFKAALEGMELKYEFILMDEFNVEKKDNYTEVICKAFENNKYDAIVGDISITPNRSLCADFTLPYTDIGVGMIVRKESNSWIFLKPFTLRLWLTIVGIYLLTASVIWLMERPPAPIEQGPQSLDYHVGRILSFSFSVLVFSQWEKLSRNSARAVFLVWVFVVVILGSSYTATLTSMLTVQQIEMNSKSSNIGHQIGSATEEVISTQNIIEKFRNSSSLWFSTPDDYAEALSKGIENGTVVDAIVDEIPYIKIFLKKYSADYSMIQSASTTNGFGFVFPKGSHLVANISRNIARLRVEGKLEEIGDNWFKSSKSFASEDTSESNNVIPLTVEHFGGLFLIYGTISGSAFVLFLATVLYRKYWKIVREYWRRPEFVNQYLISMTISKRTNVVNNTPRSSRPMITHV